MQQLLGSVHIMDGFVGGSGFPAANMFGQESTGGDAHFDASQYAFFGNNAVEEVELGGLEDEGELSPFEFDDFHKGDQEEDFGLESSNEADDFANTFSKLSRVAGRSASVIDDRVSRESRPAS